MGFSIFCIEGFIWVWDWVRTHRKLGPSLIGQLGIWLGLVTTTWFRNYNQYGDWVRCHHVYYYYFFLECYPVNNLTLHTKCVVRKWYISIWEMIYLAFSYLGMLIEVFSVKPLTLTGGERG